jgi:hypothetical protein
MSSEMVPGGVAHYRRALLPPFLCLRPDPTTASRPFRQKQFPSSMLKLPFVASERTPEEVICNTVENGKGEDAGEDGKKIYIAVVRDDDVANMEVCRQGAGGHRDNGSSPFSDCERLPSQPLDHFERRGKWCHKSLGIPMHARKLGQLHAVPVSRTICGDSGMVRCDLNWLAAVFAWADDFHDSTVLR